MTGVYAALKRKQKTAFKTALMPHARRGQEKQRQQLYLLLMQTRWDDWESASHAQTPSETQRAVVPNGEKMSLHIRTHISAATDQTLSVNSRYQYPVATVQSFNLNKIHTTKKISHSKFCAWRTHTLCGCARVLDLTCFRLQKPHRRKRQWVFVKNVLMRRTLVREKFHLSACTHTGSTYVDGNKIRMYTKNFYCLKRV